MRIKDFSILVVDDEPNDRDLITRAFRRNGVTEIIHCAGSGEEALAFLKGEGKHSDRSLFKYPSFIITDLKMPDGDGFVVLEHLKSNPEWAIIPTVVLSASNDPDDIKRAYMLGASAYLAKPASPQDLQKLLKVLFDFWMACEIPAVDLTGRRLTTDSRGKLGERYLQCASR